MSGQSEGGMLPIRRFKTGYCSGILNLGHLSRGLYILRLESNDTWFTKKILKQ